MPRLFKAIRAGEHRDTWAAFSVLFGLLASHALLETARDALFLAKIPATRLPWMYLAIAAVTLAVTQAQARLATRLSPQKGLSAWIAGSGAVTFAFWWLLPLLGSLGLYALYIWSGVLTTLVMVHFWNLLGDTFSVTQAKRLYGLIGAGSVLGAIFGTGAASAASTLITPNALVLASAAGMGATSLLPLLFRAGRGTPPTDTKSVGFLDSAGFVARHPYASRIALLVILSTAAVTLADFLFKQTVAAEVPAEDLGAYFATVSFVLNVLSLLFQVVLVGWLLRRFDLSTALVLLPALLVLGSAALIVLPGLVGALFLKGADGSLRYSVHRTATELLYVPLSESARRRVKGFIDVVGQRGGQAGASMAILTLTAVALGPRVLAFVLALVAVAWVACAIAIQKPYLDIFRRHLQDSASRADEFLFPDLDMASLENLVAALDSQSNDEVVAALDLLDREGRSRLVPALILYHPSEAVVLRALGMFARTGRKNMAHVVERLLSHSSAAVRAQAAAAYARLVGDAQRLRMMLSTEESREVRAAIMVNLIAAREIVGSDAKDVISALITTGSRDAKLAMIEAIASRGASGFEDVLVTMMELGDIAVSRAAVRAAQRLRADQDAARQLRAEVLVPALVASLGREATRKDAIAALPVFGELALDALERTMSDRSTDQYVRWHVPRAIAGFEPQRAATALVRALEDDDPDGMMRYQIIRALERVVAKNPTVSLYQPTLEKAISHTVSRAFRYVDRRLSLHSGGQENPGRKTAGYEILDRLLQDKVAHGIDRLFRLLRLLYPDQPVDDIHKGLSSSKAADRASSMELLHSILRPPLRSAVIALVDDIPDTERLGAAGRYHQPLRLSFEGLLAALLRSTSETLQDVTAYYIGELGLTQYREQLGALIEAGAARVDIVHAHRLLGEPKAMATVMMTTAASPAASSRARTGDAAADKEASQSAPVSERSQAGQAKKKERAAHAD